MVPIFLGTHVGINMDFLPISPETFEEECGKYLGGLEFSAYTQKTKVNPVEILACLDSYYSPVLDKTLTKCVTKTGEVRIMDSKEAMKNPIM